MVEMYPKYILESTLYRSIY